MSTKRIMIWLLACAAIIAMALPAAAKDKTITVIDDDGETYVCTYIDGERLRVVNQDTGEEVLDFDIEDLEDTIEDAMEEVEDALEEIEDLDLDIHFGDDSYLRMELGDERVFVDVDAIIGNVMEALEAIDFESIDLGEIHWDDDDHDHEIRVRHRERIEDDKDSLEDELDELRDEIKELKRELRKASRNRRH